MHSFTHLQAQSETGTLILSTIYAFLEVHNLLEYYPEAEPPRAQECPSWRAPLSIDGQAKATELSAEEASNEVRQRRMVTASATVPEMITQTQGYPHMTSVYPPISTKLPNQQPVTHGSITGHFPSTQAALRGPVGTGTGMSTSSSHPYPPLARTIGDSPAVSGRPVGYTHTYTPSPVYSAPPNYDETQVQYQQSPSTSLPPHTMTTTVYPPSAVINGGVSVPPSSVPIGHYNNGHDSVPDIDPSVYMDK